MSVGISFEETMKGHFATGVQDPERGAETGNQNNLVLRMDAKVTIDDLDQFVADPRHLGALEGYISYPTYGDRIPSTRGVFNLFSPSDEPDLKLMVYELAIKIDNKDHYFAGHKRVRNDGGVDLWTDTTTLFSTMHAGPDKEGPIVGAGVIRLGVSELRDLLLTLKVTGTDSGAQKLAAITKFGKFFLGELWDTYAQFAPR